MLLPVSRPAVGVVALFALFLAFSISWRGDLKIPLFMNRSQHMPTPFSRVHGTIVAQNTSCVRKIKVKVLRLALPLFT
jgi:hypothetical protein